MCVLYSHGSTLLKGLSIGMDQDPRRVIWSYEQMKLLMSSVFYILRQVLDRPRVPFKHKVNSKYQFKNLVDKFLFSGFPQKSYGCTLDGGDPILDTTTQVPTISSSTVSRTLTRSRPSPPLHCRLSSACSTSLSSGTWTL